ASAIAAWAFLAADTATAARAAFFAGTVVTVAAACVWLTAVAARPVLATRRWLERLLSVPAQRLVAGTAPASREMVSQISPGEHVLVETGETVPVDLELTEGDVEICPWVGAAHRLRRAAGDHAVAGARVTQGQARGVCTAAGLDRALARPLLAPDRRCDVHSRVAQWGRRLAQQWAWLAAFVAGLATLLLSWDRPQPIEAAMVAVAVGTALGNVAVGTLAALSIARGVTAALGHGIVHNSAAAWDRCSEVSAAVFCARGTLLRGEPELAEVETFSDRSVVSDVLALAAGAVGVDRSPWAVAIRRGARDRGVSPEPIRNPRAVPGAGATAVGASGETVCVGNRALMVQRRVSVAVAESRMAELEALGRTVLLASRAGRLIGLVALQDGLRPGARAAVQHVIDAGMEPVLISSDSSATCQALGRSLDIEHLRAEVPEAERADVIGRIKDGGATVAVLGHTPHDDAALGAADASVALAAAGRASDDFSASLVSDDVRDAALALAIAQRTRKQAGQVLGLMLGPALLGSLVVAAGLLPPEYAPLAALLGAVAAVAHLRSWDRTAEPEGR
ncbi:MAG: cation-translocating P-type ATPase, partial [Deltaproteobacteria bacterium]|nr:cation-translocating P-type ATPase [Deltaproteobacteria bacterium]MBW2531883.1 cation-translocating P-type ATPase [Deltaproteobacteria bacterium]